MILQNMYRLFVIVLISINILVTWVNSAVAENMYYPPTVNGFVDFRGHRFSVRDDTAFYGYRTELMNQNLVIQFDESTFDTGSNPISRRRLFLYQNGIGNPVLVREVKNLNDLTSEVSISSETDALEYVRFGSSRLSINLESKFNEVFCVGDDVDTQDIFSIVHWGSIDDCQRLGFEPPQITRPTTNTGDKITICHIPPGNPSNPHTIKIDGSALDAHLKHGDYLGKCDDDKGSHGKKHKKGHDKKHKKDKHKKHHKHGKGKKGSDRDNNGNDVSMAESNTFLVTRTVLSRKTYPWTFLRITEEVGLEGQWSVTDEQIIAALDGTNILFYGNTVRK